MQYHYAISAVPLLILSMQYHSQMHYLNFQFALSQFFSVIQLFISLSYSCLYVKISTLDEGSRRREERNIQQRNRRAQMTDEQREEIRRKQREYQRD
jgi:hypothetical protein